MQTAKGSRTDNGIGTDGRKGVTQPFPRKHSEAMKMNRRIGHIIKELDTEIDFWCKELRQEAAANHDKNNLQIGVANSVSNGYVITSPSTLCLQNNTQNSNNNNNNNTNVHHRNNSYYQKTYNATPTSFNSLATPSNNYPLVELNSNATAATITGNTHNNNNGEAVNLSVCQANLQRCISMKEALLKAQITGKSARTDAVLQKGLSLVNDILAFRNNETVQEINHLAHEVDRKRAELRLGEEIHSFMIAKGTGALYNSDGGNTAKVNLSHINDPGIMT